MASGTAVYRPLTLQVSTACVKPGHSDHPKDAPSVNNECEVFASSFYFLGFFSVCFLHFNPDVCIVLSCPSCSVVNRSSADVLYLNVPFSLINIQPKGILLYVSLLGLLYHWMYKL